MNKGIAYLTELGVEADSSYRTGKTYEEFSAQLMGIDMGLRLATRHPEWAAAVVRMLPPAVAQDDLGSRMLDFLQGADRFIERYPIGEAAETAQGQQER